MRDRNGIRIGQRVRDLDGNPLGKVTAVYETGFATRKGLPILFRRDYVLRYEEVRGERDGEVIVARSDRDLFELNAGDLPASWRIPVPPGFPAAATPPEASLVREDLVRGAIAAAAPPPPPPTSARLPAVGLDEGGDDLDLPHRPGERAGGSGEGPRTSNQR